MGSRRKALLELSRRANTLLWSTKRSSTSTPSISRTFSSSFSRTSAGDSASENDRPPQSDRDATLLEKFRRRKLKGLSEKVTQESSSPASAEKASGDGGAKVMTGFKDLGICSEVAEAVEEMGFSVPSESHCVGIPALLEGNNVVLGSLSGPERPLAYLLPFIQSLKADGERNGIRTKHPRAFILCSTAEKSDEVFQMAKFISSYGRLKSSRGNKSGQLKLEEGGSEVSIGMLVGTPDEVSELIEEQSVVPDEIKYLVFDELDAMFDLGFGPNIKKILTSVKHSTSRDCNQKCQSVVVTSTLMKMLHEQRSSLVESLKREDAGEIAAMLLEIDEDEAFHLMESPDTLKCKLAEAVKSLHASTKGT